MKAKDLIRETRLTEAGEAEGQPLSGRPPLPGTTSQPRQRPARPRRGPGSMPPGMGGEFPGEMGGIPGEPPGEPKLLSPREIVSLKDTLLLMTTEAMGNTYDGQIVRKLINGQLPSKGEFEHILQEASRIKDLPEPCHAVLIKISQALPTLSE